MIEYIIALIFGIACFLAGAAVVYLNAPCVCPT